MMKLMKTSMALAAFAALTMATPTFAADNCAKLKADLTGTTTAIIMTAPMAPFETAVVVNTTPDTLTWPNGFELDAASYTGHDYVPTVKKSDDARAVAWKPDEALVDDGKFDGHVSQSFVLASAHIPMQYGVIKAGGSVEVDGDELGPKLTF